MAVAIFILDPKVTILNERVEFVQIHMATNDFFTPSRHLAAAINQNGHILNFANL